MKKFIDLRLGYNDAANYQKKNNKDMFNEIFVKDDNLEKLIGPDVYFLIGDKGTGKTAYATYLKNNDYKNVKANVINIADTDYKTFYQLKKEHNLNLTDYTRIWKIIILMSFAYNLSKTDIANFKLTKTKKFEELKNLVEKYYHDGFEPEAKIFQKCIQDMSSNTKLGAEIRGLCAEKQFSESTKLESNFQIYQNNLLYLERAFTEAFKSLKLTRNVFLFFDNVDIAHNDISLEEYLDILKGLADAICSLNNSILCNLKDSVGYMKVVLLVRPEIFTQLNIHNQANILKDNSIYLNWQTTYANYKNSKLFELTNKILKYGNPEDTERELEDYWNEYFPWKCSAYSPIDDEKGPDNSFIEMLRYSLYRPRDLITILKTIQELEKVNNSDDFYTHKKTVDSPEFRRELANYYKDEAKDWCLYQYTSKQFETIIYFFDFIKGSIEFSYDEYCEYFNEYTKNAIELEDKALIDLILDKDAFLQLLFDLNFIGYVDYDYNNKAYYKYSYKEKSFSNLHPKVKIGNNYRVHTALARGLNAGRKYK